MSRCGGPTQIDQEEDNGGGVRPKAWIGIAIQDLTHESAEYYGLQGRKGAVIIAVFRDGPSGKAGIKVEDVITAVDSRRIEDSEELAQRIARLPVGKELTLKVIRRGKEKNVRVEMGERPVK